MGINDIYKVNNVNTASGLNTNYSMGNFLTSDFGMSAFNGYFTSSNPLGNDFGDSDLMSTLLKQQQILIGMYSASPNMFALGMPNMFNKPRSYFFGLIKKKTPPMKLSKECCSKLDKIAAEGGYNSKDLQALIYAESGGNPAALNQNGGASGTFQAMPSTLKNLNKRMGTNVTPEQFRSMSAEKQMDYFEEYLKMAKEQAGFKKGDKIDAGTLYALVFLPAYAKKDVLTTAGTKYYAANQGLDLNRDGYIDKKDLAQKLNSYT